MNNLTSRSTAAGQDCRAAAADRLRHFGVSVTRPRVAIMEYLMEHHVHPTVEQVYSALAPEYPSLSRTTVYNTMKMLAEHGAVTLLTIDDRNLNIDENTTPHAHLYCTRCHRIHDLPLQGVSPLQASYAFTLDGHLIQQVHQYYKGVCRECQTDLNKEPLLTNKQ